MSLHAFSKFPTFLILHSKISKSLKNIYLRKEILFVFMFNKGEEIFSHYGCYKLASICVPHQNGSFSPFSVCRLIRLYTYVIVKHTNKAEGGELFIEDNYCRCKVTDLYCSELKPDIFYFDYSY